MSTNFTPEVVRLLEQLKNQLTSARNRRVRILLVGRTGVGKSSTINSLFGSQIAPTGAYEPTTMEIVQYDTTLNGVPITIYDTPGLCDDLPERGNDASYLLKIRKDVAAIDIVWFVTPLNDTRVRSDEQRGIQLITEAFTSNVWKHSVIVFPFANMVNNYSEALKERHRLIKQAITKSLPSGSDTRFVSDIPAVAVDNLNTTTPDKRPWLPELMTKTINRINETGLNSFVLSLGKNISDTMFTDIQSKQIKDAVSKTDVGKTIAALSSLGASIGFKVGGPIGAVIGGVVGAVVGFFKNLFSW